MNRRLRGFTASLERSDRLLLLSVGVLLFIGIFVVYGAGSYNRAAGTSPLGQHFIVVKHLVMIGIGVVLVRRVFVVFGAIGCSIYLGHLANEVFENSWLFPSALTAIGLGIIYLGVIWQRHEQGITQKVRSYLPAPLRELLEERTA